MIKAIVDEEPDIRNIMVVGQSPPRILAASNPGIRGIRLDDLKDDHLRLEIADALRNGVFGSHFESDQHPDQAGMPGLPDLAARNDNSAATVQPAE